MSHRWIPGLATITKGKEPPPDQGKLHFFQQVVWNSPPTGSFSRSWL